MQAKATHLPSRRRTWIRRIGFAFGLLLLLGLTAWGTGWAWQFCRDRARSALEAYRWRAAERWLSLDQTLGPGNGEGAFLQARLARKLGDLETMVKHLDQAQSQKFDPLVLQREVWLAQAQGGNLGPLESQLSDLFVKNEDLPEICEAFVRGCLMTHRLEEAVKVLELWQADYPNSPLPHALRGRILEFQVHIESAMDEYRLALEKDPGFGTAAYSLGRVQVTRQETEEALAVYQSCKTTLYDPEPALVKSAQCLRLLGRLGEARSVLMEASSANSSRALTAWVLAGEPVESAPAQLPAEWGYLELEAENWEESARWFQQALEANPQDWRGRYAFATALRQSGQITEAEKQLKIYDAAKTALASCDPLMKELKTHPDNVEARYQVGKVLLEHVSAHQGLIWLNSVLTYDSTHEPTHRLLAEYYAEHAHENSEFARLAKEHAQQLDD